MNGRVWVISSAASPARGSTHHCMFRSPDQPCAPSRRIPGTSASTRGPISEWLIATPGKNATSALTRGEVEAIGATRSAPIWFASIAATDASDSTRTPSTAPPPRNSRTNRR